MNASKEFRQTISREIMENPKYKELVMDCCGQQKPDTFLPPVESGSDARRHCVAAGAGRYLLRPGNALTCLRINAPKNFGKGNACFTNKGW